MTVGSALKACYDKLHTDVVEELEAEFAKLHARVAELEAKLTGTATPVEAAPEAPVEAGQAPAA